MAELKVLKIGMKSERTNFSKSFENVVELLNKTDVNVAKLKAKLRDFYFHAECLDSTHTRILELLTDSTEFELEFKLVKHYQELTEQLKQKARKILDDLENGNEKTPVQTSTVKSERDTVKVENLETQDCSRNSPDQSKAVKLRNTRIIVQNFISRNSFANKDQSDSRKLQAEVLGDELLSQGYFSNPLEWLYKKKYLNPSEICFKCSTKRSHRRWYKETITRFWICSKCTFINEFNIPSFFPFGKKLVPTMIAIFHWVLQSSYDALSKDIQVDDFTVIKVYEKLQEVCSKTQNKEGCLGTEKGIVEVAFFRYADTLILGARERDSKNLLPSNKNRTRIHVFSSKEKLCVTEFQKLLSTWISKESLVIVNPDQPSIIHCFDADFYTRMADKCIKDEKDDGYHTLTITNYVINHLKSLSKILKANEMSANILQLYFDELAWRESNENIVEKEFSAIFDCIFSLELKGLKPKDMMEMNFLNFSPELMMPTSSQENSPLSQNLSRTLSRIMNKANISDTHRNILGVYENGTTASEDSQRIQVLIPSDAAQESQIILAPQVPAPTVYDISSNSSSNEINLVVKPDNFQLSPFSSASTHFNISSDLPLNSSLKMEESIETDVHVFPVILLEPAVEQIVNTYPVEIVESCDDVAVVYHIPENNEENLSFVLQENSNIDLLSQETIDRPSPELWPEQKVPGIDEAKTQNNFHTGNESSSLNNPSPLDKNSSIFSMQKVITKITTGNIEIDIDNLFTLRVRIPLKSTAKDPYTLRNQLREQNFMTLLPWWLVEKQCIPLLPPCNECNGKVFCLKSHDKTQDQLCWICDQCRKGFPFKRPKLFEDFKSFSLEELLLCTYHWACKSSLWGMRYDVDVSSQKILKYFNKLQYLCGKRVAQEIFKGSDANHKTIVEASVIKLGNFFILCALDRYRKVSRLKAISAEEAWNSKKHIDVLGEWLGKDCILITEQRISDNFLNGVIKIGSKKVFVSGKPVFSELYGVSAYLQNLMNELFQNLRHDQLSILTVQRLLDEVQWRERYGQSEEVAFWNILNEIKQFNKSFEKNSEDIETTVAALGKIKKDRHHYMSDGFFLLRWAPTSPEANSLLTSLTDANRLGEIKQLPTSVQVPEIDEEIPIIPLEISFKDLLSIRILLKNDIECHQLKSKKLDNLLEEGGYLKNPIQWILKRGLVKSQMKCSICNTVAELHHDPKLSVSIGWKCKNSKCRAVKEFQSPSFFNLGLGFSLHVVLAIIYHWAVQSEYKTLTSAVPFSSTRIFGVYQKLQKLCSKNLKNQYFKLGAKKSLVEVALLKFADYFVLGAMERDSSNAWIQKRLRFHVFSPGTKLSLSVIGEVLKPWVLPRTTVIINYKEFEGCITDDHIRFEYADATVHDVNSEKYHTLTIRNYFQIEVKTIFRTINIKNMDTELLQLYLDELVWREHYMKDPFIIFDVIYQCIFSALPNDSDTKKKHVVEGKNVYETLQKHISLSLCELMSPVPDENMCSEKLSDDLIRSNVSQAPSSVSDKDKTDKDMSKEDVFHQGQLKEMADKVNESNIHPPADKDQISFQEIGEHSKVVSTDAALSTKDLLSVRILFTSNKVAEEYNEVLTQTLGTVLKREGCFQNPLRWLVKRKFVKKEFKCFVCHAVTGLQDCPLAPDGAIWLCTNTECKRTYLFKRPPFFASNLKLSMIFLIIYHWALQSDYNLLTNAVPVNEDDILEMYHRLQRVCGKILKHNIFRIGGGKSVVEVGFFKIANCYIIGALDRRSKRSRFYTLSCNEIIDMHLFQDILMSWLKPHSTIIVDYNSNLDWNFFKEKIRIKFSDSTIKDASSKKCHTLNISNYVKSHLNTMFHNLNEEKLTTELLQMFLDELAWREHCEKNSFNVFFSMFNCISSVSLKGKRKESYTPESGPMVSECGHEDKTLKIPDISSSKSNDIKIKKEKIVETITICDSESSNFIDKTSKIPDIPSLKSKDFKIKNEKIVETITISDSESSEEETPNLNGASISSTDELQLTQPMKIEVISDDETFTFIEDSDYSKSVAPSISNDFKLIKNIKKEVLSDDEMSDLVQNSVNLPSSSSKQNIFVTKDINNDEMSDLVPNSGSLPSTSSQDFILTKVIKKEIVSDDSSSSSPALLELESVRNTDTTISNYRTLQPDTESNFLLQSSSTQSSLSKSNKKKSKVKKTYHLVDENPHCIECKDTISQGSIDLDNHFKNKYVCDSCDSAFSTNCPKAFARHRINLLFKREIYHHDSTYKKNHSKLSQVWYCICGYRSNEGNELASHLVECRKSTCYAEVDILH